MFNLFNRRRVYPTLAANPAIFPGDREGDKGQIRMSLELVFDDGDDAREFLMENRLPTVIFDRRQLAVRKL